MKIPLYKFLTNILPQKASTGIRLPTPRSAVEDSDAWQDIEVEEIINQTAVLEIPKHLRCYDPFDDNAYLPINEINLYDETDNSSKKKEAIQKVDVGTISYKKQFIEHQKELKHMSMFCVSLFSLGLLPYTSTALADYRPWVSGEKAPLVGLWYGGEVVIEAQDGTLVTIDEPNDLELALEMSEASSHMQEEQEVAAPTKKVQTLPPLERRYPAVPEEFFIPDGALDKYFTQLALLEGDSNEQRVVRALVWGDSTIANDGIIKNVRNRMQTRFGDAGPGFLSAQVDPRWSVRRDIVRKPKGYWSTKTIVFGGGNDGRYGLAGTVSTAAPGAQVTLGGIKNDDNRQPLHRFQVFYQKKPGGGTLNISTQSKAVSVDTSSENYSDGHYNLYVKHGDPYIYLNVEDSSVTIYGVALENDNSGVTWETFGVAGSSVASMQKQQLEHITKQVELRDPALLVYWTGGNELGYPSVRTKTGKVYKRIYRKVVQQLRKGAPDASCLLIGPLDQAMKARGTIVSKPTLDNIIHYQREVAKEEGCAYWDARAVMGGENSFKRWLQHSPAMASPDLAHLTGRGRHIVGETLSDVMIRAYDEWLINNPDILSKPPESTGESSLDSYKSKCDENLTNDAELQDSNCTL
jgi:hypothetical protein